MLTCAQAALLGDDGRTTVLSPSSSSNMSFWSLSTFRAQRRSYPNWQCGGLLTRGTRGQCQRLTSLNLIFLGDLNVTLKRASGISPASEVVSPSMSFGPRAKYTDTGNLTFQKLMQHKIFSDAHSAHIFWCNSLGMATG